MDGFSGSLWFRGQNEKLVKWVMGLSRKHDRRWRYESSYSPGYCFICAFGGPSGESGYDDPSNKPFWIGFQEELDARGVNSKAFCENLSQNIARCSGDGEFGHCWPMLHGNFLDRVLVALREVGWSNEKEESLLKVRPIPDKEMPSYRDLLRPRPRRIVAKS